MIRKIATFPGLCILFLMLTLFLPGSGFSASRTLVLFPLAIYAEHPQAYVRQGLRTMFLSRLSGGGLDVVTEDSFSSLLTTDEKSGKITRQRVEEVTRKLKADYAVFGSVTTMGGGSSMDLSLLDLTKTPPALTPVTEAVTEDQFIPRIADVANRFRAIVEGRRAPTRGVVGLSENRGMPETPSGLFAALGKEGGAVPEGEEGFFRSTRQPRAFEPRGRISLHMTVESFDAGDLTGDGNTELVVLGRNELRIYGKKGETFQMKDSLKTAIGEDFIRVSVGDVDGNGKAEIYLVSFYSMRARTTVYEWNGTFRQLFRREGHLSAVRDARGGRPRLLFQNSRTGAFFSGRISQLEYDGAGKTREVRQFPALKGVRFYSLILYDINKDGNPELIGLGEGDALHIWNGDGSVLWTEERRIGGTNNRVLMGDTHPEQPLHWVSFEARPVIMDIDGDGKKDLIAIKNIAFIKYIEDMKVYVKSKLLAYKIGGAGLSPGWDTREIDYALADMQVVGQRLFLAAQKGTLSNIGKGSSRIMWFDFNEGAAKGQ